MIDRTPQKVFKYHYISWDGKTLEHLQNELPALIEKYGKDATLDITAPPDSDVCMSIYYERLETPEEVEKRLERETYLREAKLRQYATLKKELGL